MEIDQDEVRFLNSSDVGARRKIEGMRGSLVRTTRALDTQGLTLIIELNC